MPVDREILPYSSIINGPIDADKCDYLSRDSHVTRVPVAVDISRITQKLSVVKNEEIWFSELWHKDANAGVGYYELAMQDYIEDMSVQCLESGKDGWFENDEQRKLTKKVLYEIGLSVMQSSKMSGDSYKEGWSQERIERAALGYRDAQQMVFLKSSVPTYTITAFWAEGIYKDAVWKPLFKRTRK